MSCSGLSATVIVQKSPKEGFGLTISKALWKGKPVVVPVVGDIPLQTKSKSTGLPCYTVDGVAYAIRQLFTRPEYASWLGKNGRGHVRQDFLTPVSYATTCWHFSRWTGLTISYTCRLISPVPPACAAA